MSLTDEERQLWTIVCEADIRSEIADSHHKDGEAALRWSRVSARARIALRDKFGVNIEKLTQLSQSKLADMYDAELAKEQAEKRILEEAEESLARAKELLKDKGISK